MKKLVCIILALFSLAAFADDWSLVHKSVFQILPNLNRTVHGLTDGGEDCSVGLSKGLIHVADLSSNCVDEVNNELKDSCMAVFDYGTTEIEKSKFRDERLTIKSFNKDGNSISIEVLAQYNKYVESKIEIKKSDKTTKITTFDNKNRSNKYANIVSCNIKF